MKKLISITLILAMVLSLCTMVTFADDGLEFSYFYDFEDYTGGAGSVPDNHWGKTVRWNASNPNVTSGATFAPEETNDAEHGTVMFLPNDSQPSLFFDQLIKTGSIHISFDAKCTDPAGKKRLMVNLYDGRTGNEARYFKENGYSKTFSINQNARGNSLNWYQTNPGTTYQNSMSDWNLQTEEADFDSYNWHHYDIVSTDMAGGTSAYMTYYVDGRKVNEHPVYFMGAAKGFWALNFLVGNVGADPNGIGSAGDGKGFLLDNVGVRRFYGQNSLALYNVTQGKRVALNDGVLKVRTSEKITDTSLLTKDNISIKNSIDDTVITNFDVENTTEFGFDIAFDGELASGKYKILLDPSIAGNITGMAQTNALEFQTMFKFADVTNQYMNIDFEDYTDTDGTLPEGFFRQDSSDTSATYATAAEHDEDEDNQTAFGFNFTASSRLVKRYVHSFEAPINAGKEFELSFDAMGTGATWNLYLLRSEDLNTSNSDYLNNSILSVNTNTGVANYSEDRRTTPNKSLTTLQNPGEWHNVKIKVIPNAAGDTTVEFTFDNGSSIIKEITRDFYNADTAGIAIGSAPANGKQLAFDNFMLESNMSVMYPEVTDISLFDRNGDEIEFTGRETTMISKLEVEFSTLIADGEYLRDVILFTEDDVPLYYNYELQNDIQNQTSTMVLDFSNGMLQPIRTYKLMAQSGVKAYYAQQIESFLESSLTFKTAKDTGYFIEDLGFDELNEKATVRFTKNTDDEGVYIYSIAIYDEESIIVDGEPRNVSKLTDYQAQIITIDRSDKGIFEFSIPMTCSPGQIVKTYLWNYPSMQKLEL